MKVYHHLILILLFTSFFWNGLWVGRKIGTPIARQISETSPQPQTVPGYLSLPGEMQRQASLPSQAALPAALTRVTTLPSPTTPKVEVLHAPSQRNILIVGVDDLESPAARLESVWMILYLTNSPVLTLMPIYPSVSTEDGQPPEEDVLLAANFRLTQDGAPEPSFFAILQTWGMWWSGYVLLDETALTQIVGWLSRVNQDMRFETSQAIIEAPRPSEDFNAAYKSQTWLVQKLCDSIRQLNQTNTTDVSGITTLIPLHLRTDLDVIQMIEEWQGILTQQGDLGCELPFLSVTQ